MHDSDRATQTTPNRVTALANSRLSVAVQPRGPLSELLSFTIGLGAAPSQVERGLAGVQEAADRAVALSPGLVVDEDIQLSLFLLYGLHYGSIPNLEASLEWHPSLIAARLSLEAAFEHEVRSLVDVHEPPAPRRKEVAAWLFRATAPQGPPRLPLFIARSATLEQVRELLIQRSIYTLREADPHSWAIPRLTGTAKAALVEIQSDEYGGGDPKRVHATIFAQTMRGAGLDDTYGAYLDQVPAITLASQNMMSMFGLNRRLLGAIVGHLAAFEMTSSIPSKLYGDGFRRLGFAKDVTWYFDEHVEADAVHEQIAGHDLAGSLAQDRPELLADILFGALACLALDDMAGEHLLGAWQRGESSLRRPATALVADRR
ncbi:iron-containing redox enzyme family protein [Rarobacter faecitabidus]|uniref:Heme oxygenase-like protein n=1 Tax=Rarobacter faecitabidus TaxID=13243 RepID=A0A542ZAZ1_RARFA|nr:iron-containing redox enzyme family protein [Rarobacter faecitabidus]TQL57420.1 heme oxygenase-like protein [Rarobacter faecitabidus]